jgi:tRNA (Thr-GGU) A37 N-methylase
MPLLEIFSQRAKDRPNPIGITAVRVIRAGMDYLEVHRLDAINGTPCWISSPIIHCATESRIPGYRNGWPSS